ncbi:MAG: hybrid sensor histidine kinase/response regulator [Candidatus Aureabacteria bacterium]|nr:hybrid sensor histidine kinase/response regulator [Candidatus Auribacterota bacterium]
MNSDKMKILHIEDNVSNRKLVRKILEAEGYDIVEATNGIDGYDMALKRPDLILMDINIPGIDGRELSTKIKSTDSIKDIPIIAITSNVMKGDREKALIAGCDGYIPKPIDIETFPEQIKTYLVGKREKVEGEEEKELLKDYSRSLVDKLEEKVLELEKANRELKSSNVEIIKSSQLLKETQEELIQTEKMSSLGRFTASIIHEINNPVGNVLNYSQLVLERAKKDKLSPDDLNKMVTVIHEQGEKISGFIKELLSFSRKDFENFEVSNFNKIVDKIMLFLQKDVRYPNVQFEINIPGDLREINCIESRIEQVLVNLINNARYAIWKKFGEVSHNDKKIIITAREIERNGKNYSVLSIKDFGTGISKDKIKHVFEPFFTTKPKKEGTGLGLSICFQIIEHHGGTIEVFSEEGVFTEFAISIPCNE